MAGGVGTRVAGRYVLERELGRGASGRVWLARDLEDGGAARALKLVAAGEQGRLCWEFSVLRALSHPNLTAVHALVRIDRALPELELDADTLALVSDLAPGESASDLALGLQRDPDALLALCLQVADGVSRALAALHARGLVHGDVKPDNIVVLRATGDVPGRCSLVDLGMAGPAGEPFVLAGTLAYMAPELFRGERGPAADLYALGVSLHQLLRAAPFATSGSAAASEPLRLALLPQQAREPLPAWTPPALAGLVNALLEPDPRARFGPALELRARIAPLAAEHGVAALSGTAPALRGDAALTSALGGADDGPSPLERAAALQALPLVGQRAALDALCAALEQPGARGQLRAGVISVLGPHGAGRSRLVREAVGVLQARAIEVGHAVPSYAMQPRLPQRAFGSACVLHVADGDDVRAEDARALLQAAAVDGCALGLVLERSEALAGDAFSSVELGALPEGDVRKLLEHALPGARVSAALVREALVLSGGLAGRLCAVLAQALRAGADPSRPQALRALVETAPQADPSLAALPQAARELAELLAVAGGELEAEAVGAALGGGEQAHVAYRALLALGVATVDEARLCLRRDLVAQLRAQQSPARVLELAGRLPEARLAGHARAHVLLARGQRGAALQAFLAELERVRAAGAPERAATLAAEALRALQAGELGNGAVSVEAREERAQLGRLRAALGDALRAQGRYQDALQAIEALGGAAAEAQRAELYRLLGMREPARAAAEQALALASGDDDDASNDRQCAAEAEGVLARLAFDAGELDEAERRAAAAAARGEQGAAQLRAAEVQLLVALHRGDALLARRLLAQALERARGLGARAVLARLTSLAGELCRRDGDTRGASARFAEAFELADRAGEQHAAAAFLHNVGVQRLDGGEPGPAIAALRDAARRLARLGRDSDLCRVLYNLGQAAQLIGADDLALSSAERAIELAARVGDAATLAYAGSLLAEQRLLRGERKAVVALLAHPLELAALPLEAAASAAARRACLHLALGETDAAERWLARAEQLIAGGGTEVELEPLIARSQLELDAGRFESAVTSAERARSLAQAAGSFDARLRAGLLAARAQRAAGHAALAGAHLSEVRALLDDAARGLSSADRARLRAIEAYRPAFEAAPAAAPAEPSADARWRALAGTAKQLASEQRLSRLRDQVLAAALELSGAERGYLVAKDGDGVPRVRAARGLLREELERDEHALSRSIIARVLGSGRPLRTMDAASDDRLSAAASVHALSLRSVLAVPLRIRGEVRGAIYLEDRLRPFAFGEVELALLSDLGDLAALALDSAEQLRAERRAARRMTALRVQLARKLESQTLELDALKRERGDESGLPAGIVAHSRGMRRVLATVARVARADVPVLICGESGTGKELVARAIHGASERRAAAFVSENCGAIPEPLLESALFGHVRGAFTGADRRHLGLFELADGGSLLLDEIGEMSPAMQARLLRVLQDGEVRPVGGERARRVDVRVLAATHRDLPAMVASGRFREDLFYRLAVMQIDLPPLRERIEDIAPLAHHFLRAHARGRAVELAPAALAALGRHPWPGNVRQLENEIRRALVLSDGVITTEHLSAELAGHGAALPADPLDLRARVGELERGLIRQALEAAHGNQTRAARMLGVSRFGLQKMLRRLGS